MKNYDEMSDFEVNVLLASHLHPECNHAHTVDENKNGEAEFWCADPIGETRHAGRHNYCNDWLDIGSLIDEYKINLVAPNCGCKWRVFVNVDFNGGRASEHFTYNENPKRAAAICLIKLLES